jgi:hypothetical protein
MTIVNEDHHGGNEFLRCNENGTRRKKGKLAQRNNDVLASPMLRGGKDQ